MGSFKRAFIRFSQECETSDSNLDKELRTKYYKSSFDKAFAAVEELFAAKEYTIQSISKDHGEILVGKKGKLFIVATVLTVRPFETAVDFKVTSEKMILTGAYPKLKSEVLALYNGLNQKLKPFQQ
ncbi:cytosolic protein [Bacillus sp. 2205SS5-2]|uniref:cytosolic protein n=1 Tax=Bacillus sp. 2205SS5-2 TaxID=3109031 RepID=UPI003006D2A1